VQRDRAEHKVKEQRDAIRRSFFYPSVIDHLRREFPHTSTG